MKWNNRLATHRADYFALAVGLILAIFLAG